MGGDCLWAMQGDALVDLWRVDLAVTVPKKSIPKRVSYSDGKGGLLTEVQWIELTDKEREKIQKLVNDQLARIYRGEQP